MTTPPPPQLPLYGSVLIGVSVVVILAAVAVPLLILWLCLRNRAVKYVSCLCCLYYASGACTRGGGHRSSLL